MRPLFILSILFILSSCSSDLRPFTQRVYDDFNWSENEIESIQFYVSEDIRLWRDFGGESSTIKNGKVRVIDGREIEEVIIRKGTPGVVVFSPKENRFAVSFNDDDDAFLMFGPNEKANGRYVLLAKEWKNRRGKVTYNGKIYNTDLNSAYAALLFDIKAARKRNYNSTIVSGRRVD
jgi:hypothetical protein